MPLDETGEPLDAETLELLNRPSRTPDFCTLCSTPLYPRMFGGRVATSIDGGPISEVHADCLARYKAGDPSIPYLARKLPIDPRARPLPADPRNRSEVSA